MKGKRESREAGGEIYEMETGVDGRRPGYLVREELKRGKLRGRAKKRGNLNAK